jgi:hypothetical protein
MQVGRECGNYRHADVQFSARRPTRQYREHNAAKRHPGRLDSQDPPSLGQHWVTTCQSTSQVHRSYGRSNFSGAYPEPSHYSLMTSDGTYQAFAMWAHGNYVCASRRRTLVVAS